MIKVRVDKLECRCPVFFKIMFLSFFGKNSSLVNLTVVIIASFFLYDIWKFAEIK